jgi:Fe-Mn family superoxide dismutase
MSNRRDFLKKGGLLGLASLTAKLISNNQLEAIESLGKQSLDNNPFTLPKLPYAFDALEPYIDKQTMEIHYTKHHQGYVNKLNELKSTSIDYSVDDATKCKQINKLSVAALRNNLGGHYNHSLFWTLLKPNPKGEPNRPNAKLNEAIANNFKSFEEFKTAFSEASVKLFGSGWCWLIVTTTNKLKILTTPNQDNPLMQLEGESGKLILALDVWEHAYYLKHQNKRKDYIEAWWNIINWEKCEELFVK